MKNLLIRSLTGIIFVGITLGSLFLGPIAFGIVFSLVLAIGMNEFYSFFKSSDYKPARVTGIGIGLILFVFSLLIASGKLSFDYFMVPFVLMLIIPANELFRNKKTPIENAALSFFALLYVAFPISIINLLIYPTANQQFTPKILIAILAIIWIYDSGAYLVGITIGKHRMFERVSPKKSWEGAIGGTIVALAASYGVALFVPEISQSHWIILSFLIVVSSTLGDLTESLLKRTVGVKDSGSLLPGHGGILDRFDSLLFAAPVVAAYLEIILN